jgi:small subunit ribosomal protein S4
LGFGRTRRQARQFVTHRHVMVNERVVNVPSYELRPDDVVSIRPKSQQLEVIQENVSRNRRTFNWLEVDREKMEGRFINYPERQDIPENINAQLIVELYSK